ncbi:AraC family transcriptional regulator [Streptomyces sp. NPDC005811]|uniref:AraC family transcriptional regulator n=1 Tax=Streptomyces sp. NPDC005811 TaxID=3154565 RepID=UPI0033D696CA
MSAVLGLPKPLAKHRLFETDRLEEATEHGRRLLARHRLIPSEGGKKLDAVVNGVDLDGSRLLYMRYGKQLRVTAEPMRDWYGVHLPLKGRLSAWNRGSLTTTCPGQGAVFGPLDPVMMDWSESLELLVFWISRDHLDESVRTLSGRRLDGTVTFAANRASDAPMLRSLMLCIAATVDAQPNGLAPAVRQEVRRSLLSTIVLTQEHSHSPSILQHDSHALAPRVHRLIHEVDANPRGDHAVGALAARAGLSERSVQMWFRRETGMSPNAYVRAACLRGAREEILSASGRSNSIGEIAAAWGFSNAGRFAQEYRREYGEQPSSTLRRSAFHPSSGGQESA